MTHLQQETVPLQPCRQRPLLSSLVFDLTYPRIKIVIQIHLIEDYPQTVNSEIVALYVHQ